MVGFSVYASNPSLSGAPNPPPVVGTGIVTFGSASAGPFFIPVPPLTGSASRMVLNASASVPGMVPFTATIDDTTNLPGAPFMVAGDAGGTITVTILGTAPGVIAGAIMANALVGAERAILSAVAA